MTRVDHPGKKSGRSLAPPRLHALSWSLSRPFSATRTSLDPLSPSLPSTVARGPGFRRETRFWDQQASRALPKDPRRSASPNFRVQGRELAGPRQSRVRGAVQHPEAGRVPPGPPQPPPPALSAPLRLGGRVTWLARRGLPAPGSSEGPDGRTDGHPPTHPRWHRAGGAARGDPGTRRAGRAGAWACRGCRCTVRAGRAGRGLGTAAAEGPPWRPPLSPRGARDAAADVAPSVAGLHRRRTKTPPQPPPAAGSQPPSQP